MSRADYLLILGIGFLLLLSLVVLLSIAPYLFPLYFLYYILAIVVFVIFSQIDFDIISLFSKHLFIGSIIFLILPLLIGRVTRGAVRWIPLGALTLQPAEIVRPFLLVFFANFLTAKELSLSRLIKALVLLLIPVLIILRQLSLGVAMLTAIGFLGIFVATEIKKKYVLFGILTFIAVLPIIWFFLAPYQKQRVLTFLEPGRDPYGAGYNSFQSMVSVGSGKLFGRGLGKGIGTQLAFLPERHTDFIFASTAEELGLVGATLLLAGGFFILSRLVYFIEKADSPAARAFVSGLFLTLFVQMFVHVGMNLGLLPITGVPFPLVSAGGSSLLGTMLGLGIAVGAKRRLAV